MWLSRTLALVLLVVALMSAEARVLHDDVVCCCFARPRDNPMGICAAPGEAMCTQRLEGEAITTPGPCQGRTAIVRPGCRENYDITSTKPFREGGLTGKIIGRAWCEKRDVLHSKPSSG